MRCIAKIKKFENNISSNDKKKMARIYQEYYNNWFELLKEFNTTGVWILGIIACEKCQTKMP